MRTFRIRFTRTSNETDYREYRSHNGVEAMERLKQECNTWLGPTLLTIDRVIAL